MPQGIEHTANEHTLAEGVSHGLNQIPAKPIYLIDAVVRDAELQCEEERGCLEEKMSSLCCLGIQL